MSWKKEDRTLAGRLTSSIRQEITDGVRLPGERLRPAEIAERYGTSLIPVREAIRVLTAHGLLRAEPNKGVYVSQLSIGTLQQVMRVRGVLEGLALSEAFGNFTEANFLALEELCDEMDRCPVSELLGLNRKFHLSIYAVAQNETLYDLIERVWFRVEPYVSLYVRTYRQDEVANEQHRQIIKLLRDSDLVGAKKIQKVHLAATTDMVSRIVGGLDASATGPKGVMIGTCGLVLGELA